jgi:hypothetical protein
VTGAGGVTGASCGDFLNGSFGGEGGVCSTARVAACERGNERKMKSGRKEEKVAQVVSKSAYVWRLPHLQRT